MGIVGLVLCLRTFHGLNESIERRIGCLLCLVLLLELFLLLFKPSLIRLGLTGFDRLLQLLIDGVHHSSVKLFLRLVC